MRKISLQIVSTILGFGIAFSPVTSFAENIDGPDLEENAHQTKRVITKEAGHDSVYHWSASYNDVCIYCGEIIQEHIGASAKHIYTASSAVRPSCLGEGGESKQCDVCGYIDKITYPATHDITDCELKFGNGKVLVYDTLARQYVNPDYYEVNSKGNKIIAKGINGYTGTVEGFCEHKNTKRESYGTSGFNESEHWKPGWCVVCSDCGITISAVDQPIYPHNLIVTNHTDPTCTKDGSETQSCDCGYSVLTNIPATHNISNCTVDYKNGVLKVLDGSTLVQSSYYTVEDKGKVITIHGSNGYTGTINFILKDNTVVDKNDSAELPTDSITKPVIKPSTPNPVINININFSAATFKIKAVIKKNKIKLNWDKQKCKGYQVKYSNKKNLKGAKTFSSNKNTHTIKLNGKLKSVKKTKKLYAKMRVYKIVNGKKVYSKWSKLKVVKIR